MTDWPEGCCGPLFSQIAEGSRVRHLDTGLRGTVRKVLSGRSLEVAWDGRGAGVTWASDLREIPEAVKEPRA